MLFEFFLKIGENTLVFQEANCYDEYRFLKGRIMKIILSSISLVAATLLFTGCGDNTTNVTTSEAQSYSISGDVKGCVVDTAGNPVAGAEVTLGNVSSKTDADGCYALRIKIVTMNSQDAAATIFADQEVLVTHERFLDTPMHFTPTENVVAGVIFDFGQYPLLTDLNPPKDTGIIDAPYANNMLIDGIDGRTKPIELQLSEFVDLADTISSDTIIELSDENQNPITSSVTATVSFDGTNNVLAVKTSESITAGYYVTVRIPANAITDVNDNPVTSGVDATVVAYGPSATNYLTFVARIYLAGDANVNPVPALSQMDADSGLLDGESYDEALSALETANSTFKNAYKSDTNSIASRVMYNYNYGGTLSSNRMKNLADAYISDPTTASTSVITDTLRIKFTPSNADHYEVKVLDDNNATITINNVLEVVNATVSNLNTTVTLIADSVTDVELAVNGSLNASAPARVVVTPFGTNGIAGVATILDIKDNVAPTTSLQYSYGGSDDTSSQITTSGGVVTSVLYGGSGELSNPEDNATNPSTLYTIGTPYLEMTVDLLTDQNATTADTGMNALPSPYTATQYAAWVADSNSSRAFGVGFTEPINISGNATLTRVDGSSASTLITNTVNTVDNLPVFSSIGLTEDIAIVTVSNIHTLGNDHNGSVLDLTAVTTDLSGNPAAVAKVILVDKMPPMIVSAAISDINATASTITFSEVVTTASASLTVGGATCTIDNNATTVNLTCSTLPSATGIISSSNVIDSNGNTQNNRGYVYNFSY